MKKNIFTKNKNDQNMTSSNTHSLVKKKSIFSGYLKYKYLVGMFSIGIIYYLIFHYYPMVGVQIAFKDYYFLKGIWGSPWIGFDHFEQMFKMRSFLQVLRNTLIISLYKLIFGFPAPIIFAILLNELKNKYYKKAVQTLSYLPHFVSWVILGGVFMQFLSPSIGPINIIFKSIGIKPIYFLGDSNWFRTTLVFTSIWKSVGWSSIVYLAALSGVDVNLYEAARIDGANKFRQIVHITLPSIVPAITIMFIFAVGSIINDDFDQIFNLYNPAVYNVGDVMSTYIYRYGLQNMKYSFATAVNLFKNVIAFALIIFTNMITKRINDYGLW